MIIVASKIHTKTIIFAVPLKKCRVGQGVKTPPFHGGITGSNPVRGTEKSNDIKLRSLLFFFLSSFTSLHLSSRPLTVNNLNKGDTTVRCIISFWVFPDLILLRQ